MPQLGGVQLTPELIHIIELLKKKEQQSNCERAKVACVLFSIADNTGVVASNGSDYPPRCQRPEAEGDCGCLHAEVHAALALEGQRVNKAIISRAPCERCAKVLAAVGVRTVYYLEDSRPMAEGFVVLDAADIYYGKISVGSGVAATGAGVTS